MMLKSEKKFDTGLRILEVLKILLISNFSKSEIIDILKDNSGIGSVYTNEAFIKYFNTLKVSGLKINKIKNKYELENALINIELTEEEKIEYSQRWVDKLTGMMEKNKAWKESQGG